MTDNLPNRFSLALTPAALTKTLTSFASRLLASTHRRVHNLETFAASDRDARFNLEDLENRVMLSVNVAPTFTMPTGTVATAEDSSLQTYSQWATRISAGSDAESSQQLYFTATTDNDALFSVPPTVAQDGTLQFAPAPDANGTAHVTVLLHDLGGTDNGGVDTSVPHTFNIEVTPVDDAPTIASLVAGASIATGTGASGTGQTFTLTAVGVEDKDGPVANVRFYEDTNNNGFLDVMDTQVGLGIQSGSDWSASVTHEGFGTARYFVQASDGEGLNSSIKSTTTEFAPISVGKVTSSSIVTGKSFKLTAIQGTGASGVEVYYDSNGNGVIDDGDQLLGTATLVGKKWKLVASPLSSNEAGFAAKTVNSATVSPKHGHKSMKPITLMVRGINDAGDAGVTQVIHTQIK